MGLASRLFGATQPQIGVVAGRAVASSVGFAAASQRKLACEASATRSGGSRARGSSGAVGIVSEIASFARFTERKRPKLSVRTIRRSTIFPARSGLYAFDGSGE